ncbi:hypothetical protein [Bacillus sp. JCM 19034]|uniref:hypothetical protein n=1 Tax=Bacillus sp. JCM 19034 TaxID=1481928 RepID=UPI0007830741|nr:hypothetical protein [Bacillus sp. JCM 19034]
MQQSQVTSQQNQQNQALMQQPPAVISTKDQLYLTDMLSWNLIAMKKAHFFAQQCQDQEIIQALENAGTMHQRHYEKILTHLNASQNQQATIPVQ